MNKKGFTLIELLLVISLLGIAFGVTSDILISLVRNQIKTQIANSLEQQANFVALKIEKDLRNASSVTDGTNAFTIDGKVNGVSYTVVYSFNNGAIYRQENVLLPLTDTSLPGGVTVTCTGECFSVTAGSPTLVILSMKFSPVGTTTPFVDINSTFVVRGTY